MNPDQPLFQAGRILMESKYPKPGRGFFLGLIDIAQGPVAGGLHVVLSDEETGELFLGRFDRVREVRPVGEGGGPGR